MSVRKSTARRYILAFLLIAFLSAILAEEPDDIGFSLGKAKAIRNCTQFSDSDAESDSFVKCRFLDKVAPNAGFCDNSLISHYSFICMEFWSPREAHLPTKADRAPPTVLS
jgi:hypothetical protein